MILPEVLNSLSGIIMQVVECKFYIPVLKYDSNNQNNALCAHEQYFEGL